MNSIKYVWKLVFFVYLVCNGTNLLLCKLSHTVFQLITVITKKCSDDDTCAWVSSNPQKSADKLPVEKDLREPWLQPTAGDTFKQIRSKECVMIGIAALTDFHETWEMGISKGKLPLNVLSRNGNLCEHTNLDQLLRACCNVLVWVWQNCNSGVHELPNIRIESESAALPELRMGLGGSATPTPTLTLTLNLSQNPHFRC